MNEESLSASRNLIRYLFKKMDNELDIRFRENSRFFFALMKRATNIGVVKEDHGRYVLTEKEQEKNHQDRARHLGKNPRRKHALL